MKNSLIILAKRKDYGTDYYASILNIKKWSLFQISVSWNEYPAWPYLQIRSGTGDVLNILFWAYKFGLDVSLISRTWEFSRYSEWES